MSSEIPVSNSFCLLDPVQLKLALVQSQPSPIFKSNPVWLLQVTTSSSQGRIWGLKRWLNQQSPKMGTVDWGSTQWEIEDRNTSSSQHGIWGQNQGLGFPTLENRELTGKPVRLGTWCKDSRAQTWEEVTHSLRDGEKECELKAFAEYHACVSYCPWSSEIRLGFHCSHQICW